MSVATGKRTPLYSRHTEMGARCIEFGGWLMPLQYSGILAEHHAVRNAAGLFDVSHMGQFRVAGPGAADALDRLLTNDIRRLAVGQGQYTLMCNPDGGVLDDLIVYRMAETEYRLVVNASRTAADWAWMEARISTPSASTSVDLSDLGPAWGILALQGPLALSILAQFIARHGPSTASPALLSSLRRFHLMALPMGGGTAWVARTGYTGEDGVEMLVPAGHLLEVWDRLLETGRPQGLLPVGLGARDTLRLEACLPLYGHELTEQITPLEAGLDRFVCLDKPAFVGREALIAQKSRGAPRRCVAFRLAHSGPPPRPQYAIFSQTDPPRPIGEVASGTQSPTLGAGIGMGYVPPEFAAPETPIHIDIRGRLTSAIVTPKPLYRRPIPPPAKPLKP